MAERSSALQIPLMHERPKWCALSRGRSEGEIHPLHRRRKPRWRAAVASEPMGSPHSEQTRTISHRRASVEETAGSVGSLDPPGHTVEMNIAQNMGTTDRGAAVVVAAAGAPGAR